MISRRSSLGLLAAAALPLPATAQAPRRLRIGVGLTPNSLDPHYHNTGQNNSALRHVFDTLINELGEADLQPNLAESWKLVDDTTWEFKLRPGVVFSDGTPLTSDDIVFTFGRVPTVSNSPGLFTPYVKLVKSFETPDALTVRMKTEKPYPFLPRDVCWVQILSRKLHTGVTTDDFNSMKATIGTGPYKIVKYTPGDAVELVRNDRYWGRKQAWDTVQLRAIAEPATRLIALKAGDLDVISGVGTADIPAVQADPKITLTLTPSQEVIYLFPDSTRDTTPTVTDNAGKPMAKNPLRDVRVRRAMSMAIDRKAIVERVMQKAGAPAYQLAAPSEEGYNADLAAVPFDPAAAKKLLAEAGYPEGFKLTIYGPAGFIANDDKILPAIGGFLSRIGIATEVQSISPAVYFGKATAREYSVFMTSYQATTAINGLKALMVTKSAETGDGPFNRHLYSNKAVDDLVFQAQATNDPVARNKLVGQAMKTAMDDGAVIPIATSVITYAARKDVVKYNAVPIGWGWAMLADPA